MRDNVFAGSGPRLAARGLVVLAAAALGALSLPAQALADVTVTPSTGVQGGVLKLVFRVSEDRLPAHTVNVMVQMPEATPIAEVYPMSVPGWAPKAAARKLDKRLRYVHGGSTNQVVSSITWIRVAAATGAPDPVELSISLGPLPKTDTLVFTVVQTYSDGTVVRWADPPAAGGGAARNPAPAVTLRPPKPDPDRPAADPDAGRGADSGGYAAFYAVVSTGVVAGIGWAAWLLIRRRRPGWLGRFAWLGRLRRRGRTRRPARPARPAGSARSAGSARLAGSARSARPAQRDRPVRSNESQTRQPDAPRSRAREPQRQKRMPTKSTRQTG